MKLPAFLWVLAAVMGLVSCRTGPDAPAVEQTPTPSSTVVVEPVQPTLPPTPTPEQGKHLTICMAQEPTSLYWHGRSTIQDQAVLHGLYENDFTTLSFDYQAQGLVVIPSLAKGDAAFRVVPVDAGDEVVDAAGDVVVLEPGVELINADGELVTFNGATALMQQLVVDFIMQQRYWADGQPVTASDSVYSFHLAAHPDTPIDKYEIERTASYQATGNLTVRWTGLPGFNDESYQTNFYKPLPQHAWRDLSELQLLTAERSRLLPMGDGPYRLVEWLPGESIRLEPNPFYYRGQQDFPPLDSVTFKFIADTNQRISQLLAEECQIITHEVLNHELIPFFVEAAEAQLLQALIRPGRVRWQLSFGINSASAYGDEVGRPDWFEDARVRQAVAMCTNRQQIIDSVLAGYSFIPHSYLHEEHPLIANGAARWPFDRAAANTLLDEVGYQDTNFDGLREDPLSGLNFRVSLITGYDRTERAVAQLVKESLLECGIDVVIESLPDSLRFKEGEDNRLNGRRFDLALTQAPTYHIPACDQFASWQISGPETELNLLTDEPFAGWDGRNHTGWSNPEYDAACASALRAMPDTDDYALFHEQAQIIFAENLPVLPLFFAPQITAALPGVSRIDNNPSQDSELWDLFAIDISVVSDLAAVDKHFPGT